MYCCNPQIILNKKLYLHLNRWGSKLVFTDGIIVRPLDVHLPSPKSVGATKDNYKNWCVLTPDGECIPIYILVPCNKCELCRDRRAKEWTTRATCETNSATYPPLFVTLTYEDKYLPADGVDKVAIQKFLKRFRINWYRLYHELLDLRYFAVGEYGRKKHRPHYHLILWNVPNDRDNDPLRLDYIYRIIQKSWSEKVSDEEYSSLPLYLRVGLDRRLFGRIEVTPDRGHSGAYCMKYMHKDVRVPNGKNDFFHLSSRRGGGIGVRYLNQHLNEFRANHGITSVPVDGDNYALPRVFKEKLFPCISRIIPPHYIYQLERLYTIKDFICKTLDEDNDIHQQIKCLYDATLCRYGKIGEMIIQAKQLYKKDNLIPLPRYLSASALDDLLLNAKAIYRDLYSYQPVMASIDYLLKQSSKRAIHMELICSNLPEIDVSSAVYELRYRKRLASYREEF